jgi:hypothetical protein
MPHAVACAPRAPCVAGASVSRRRAPPSRRASPARGASSRNASASDDDLPPTEWEPLEVRRAFSTEDSEEHGALAQFMRDAGSCLAGTDTRFIVIGDAILETVAPFPATPRFAVLGAKGVCCTLASEDKTFEAHVFLKTIREVALARSERGGRKIYAIRFFGEPPSAGGGDGADAPPPRPKLTCVLHGGESGEVPAAAVERWERLAEKLA